MKRISLFAPRYRRLLLFFGPGLLTAGVVAGAATGVWWPQSTLLLAIGLVLTAIGATSFEFVSWRWLEQRSARAGTDAAIATLAFIVILGLVNFLAVRYTWRLDLTETKVFTLSPQTQQVVSSLEQPVKVWVFEPNPQPADRELLASYQRYSDRFEYEFIDPQIEIAPAERFDVQFRGEVHVEYGDRHQLVQNLRSDQALSESQLTNGIEQLRRNRLLQVYFLQGHGELSLDLVEGGLFSAASSLEESGFGVAPLNLPEVGEIPEDAAAIAIASPDRALLPGEIEALEAYLEDGGGLLILLDPDSDRSLYPLLEDWGLELDERLIVDMSGRGRFLNLGPATPLITEYGSHPIVAEFEEGISVFPVAQPVLIEDDLEDLLAVPLAIAPPEMWAERDVDEEASIEFDPERDLAGPLNLGVAVERSPEADEDADAVTEESVDAADEDPAADPQPRLVVFGNAGFATNGWFEQQLNGDLFINSVRWLAKEEDAALAIRPRELEERRIELSSQQAILLGWLALVVIPACGFIGAGVLWWLRR